MFYSMRILLVIALLVLIEFYFYKKTKKAVFFLFPVIKPSIFRNIIIAIYGAAGIYPLVILVMWIGNVINTSRGRMPENIFTDIITFIFWGCLLIMLQAILFFIVIDAARLFLLPFYKKYGDNIRLWEARILLVIISLSVVYVPVRIIYDYYAVDVTEINYSKNNLPAQLNNFKLVFISDIQADRYTNRGRLQNYVNKVNALRPDLVLIAGDLITGTPDYINLAAEYTGKIKSKYGVYSCVGDHDNWAYREDTKRSLREVTAALAKKNVKMINNGEQPINVNGAEVKITFVTNTYVESVSPVVLKNLTGHNNTKGLKIFLTHQPRKNLLDAAYSHKYDLFLAGHTHGGQITLLFPFYELTPTLVETKYVKGTFRFGDMLMIVTRGLGMSLVPLRLNSTPEITSINIAGSVK
jgi:predicted MPP superfamily phosphohydrolase